MARRREQLPYRPPSWRIQLPAGLPFEPWRSTIAGLRQAAGRDNGDVVTRMRIYSRAFDDMQGDFQKMWAFLEDDYADRQEAFVWQTGRLGDWAFGLWTEKKLFPSFKRKNAQLWLKNFSELVGFVISENCGNDFFVLARHGHEFLYPEMLAWLKANWSNRGDELVTEVHELQSEYAHALEAAGFVNKGLVAVTRKYDLRVKAEEAPSLPEGFRIVDAATYPDPLGKAISGKASWEGKDEPPTSFELLRNEYSLENPCYFPDLDLSTLTADGIHASSCVGFPDFKNRMAEIEKVSTHHLYRRRGLAEAAIRECFRRLYERGIEYAYITGYSEAAKGLKGLYEKLGGCWSKRWNSWAIATAALR
jgi:hypothetical protein